MWKCFGDFKFFINRIFLCIEKGSTDYADQHACCFSPRLNHLFHKYILTKKSSLSQISALYIRGSIYLSYHYLLFWNLQPLRERLTVLWSTLTNCLKIIAGSDKPWSVEKANPNSYVFPFYFFLLFSPLQLFGTYVLKF